jgi:outer membrane protein assembly factor BamB
MWTSLLSLTVLIAPQDWPQGPGPRGDWGSDGEAPPLEFSVRTGEGIRWQTPLPETGQGGIAVVGRRAFVTSMAPWDPANKLSPEDSRRFAHAIENREVVGKHIDAHCLDADSGELLWTRRIEGIVPAIYTYPFSDATSASPVADDEHVWFTNASGRLCCFTHAGELVWERIWTPTFDGPFNKQFEPILVRDGERRVLISMEPFTPEQGEAAKDALADRWHHLVGLDASDGSLLWRSQDGLTQYNAPTAVDTPTGPAMLIARGGPHAVPERPVGASLVSLVGPDAGKSVWRYEDPRGNHEGALQTMAHDARHAYWILKEPHDLLVVLDLKTGEELRAISLTKGVSRWSRPADSTGASAAMEHEDGVDLEQGVFPARYSLIAAGGRVFFQCYASAWGKPTVGPAYSFGRVDPTTGSVDYLEVPTDVILGEDAPHPVWRTKGTARPLNSRGIEVTGDDRCRWDGWDWVFNGSPTRVNERLYFTLATGVVYVLDAERAAFDAGALLAVGDLGVAGQTWTANSVSFAHGRLYHRTASHVICIGRD